MTLLAYAGGYVFGALAGFALAYRIFHQPTVTKVPTCSLDS
jgi:hypothetical protein